MFKGKGKSYYENGNKVKLRYSTRKFSVGVVSVLIGMSIYFSNTSVGEKLSIVAPAVAAETQVAPQAKQYKVVKVRDAKDLQDGLRNLDGPTRFVLENNIT